MATLAQRTEAVEERTDRLETVFAAFMERTDERMERTERAIERLEGFIERREQEGARDRDSAARDRESAARVLQELNQRWGELANKMGTVVEDIVAPSCQRPRSGRWESRDLVSGNCRGTVTIPGLRGLPTSGE